MDSQFLRSPSMAVGTIEAAVLFATISRVGINTVKYNGLRTQQIRNKEMV